MNIESTMEKLRNTLSTIDPEVARIRMDKLKAESEAKLAEIALEHFNASNVPLRHKLAIHLDRTGQWEKTRAKVAERLGSGFLIALLGTRGGGKTQIGVELIRKNSERRRKSLFCTAMQFFMRVKAGYKPDGDPEEKVLDYFAKPSLLVIDEIGQRSENEWEDRLLYELINRRYNAISDTLIISNQDVSQLEASLGPSLISRMRETGGIINCNWDSFRK